MKGTAEDPNTGSWRTLTSGSQAARHEGECPLPTSKPRLDCFMISIKDGYKPIHDLFMPSFIY